MRSLSYLNVDKYPVMAVSAYGDAKRKHVLAAHPSTNPITATLHALERLEDITSNGCLSHPDKLSQDKIQAYALALLQLRVCAGMARMDRLTKACDALAVTVSSLMDDLTCASPAKCEALRRFVTHARDMSRMPASEPTACDVPPLATPAMRINPSRH